MLNKYGRPLLGCTIKPKLGLSARTTAAPCYECLRGGLDFTKDDENINSQPFMRWRDRYEFVMEAMRKAEDGDRRAQGPLPERHRRRRRGHVERAEFAKRARLADHHARLPDRRASPRTRRWQLVPAQRHAAARPPRDARRDRPQTRSTASTSGCWRSGCGWPAATTCTPAPWWASSRATGRRRWAGSTSCASPSCPRTARRGIFFDQDFGPRCPGCSRWPPAASTSGTCPALVSIFGDDSILQFGGGTLGHPWGNAAGATANRVALEACVLARNEGRDLERDGAEILRAAAEHSPELRPPCRPGATCASSSTWSTRSTGPGGDAHADEDGNLLLPAAADPGTDTPAGAAHRRRGLDRRR